MKTSNLKTLLVREYWEYRTLLVKTPMILSIALVVLLGIGSFQFTSSAKGFTGEKEWFPAMSEIQKELGSEGKYLSENKNRQSIPNEFSLSVLNFMLTLGVLAGIVYSLQALIGDRKDKSILFWRSLPITEQENILSKFIMGILGFPLVYAAFSIVFIFGSLIILSIVALVLSGGWIASDIVFNTLLALPMNVFDALVTYLCICLSLTIIFAWLLFCSAYSKKTPFLLAFGVPFVVILFEKVVLHTHHVLFTLKSFFGGLAVNAKLLSQLQLAEINVILYLVSGMLTLGFLVATYWLRENRYEI